MDSTTTPRNRQGHVRRIGGAVLALTALLATGCGEDRPPADPGDGVRRAAAEYLDALRGARWSEACDRMTTSARQAVAEGGGSCAEALGAGGALPAETLDAVRRRLAGARVERSGDRATLGPLGDLPRPLRFERRDGRWLVAR